MNTDYKKDQLTKDFNLVLKLVNIIFIFVCISIFTISGYYLYRIFFNENCNIDISIQQNYNVLNINVQADEDIKSVVTLIDSKEFQYNEDTNNYTVVLPKETAKHTISIYALDADGCSTNNKQYYMYCYDVYVLNPKDKSYLSSEFEKIGIKNVYLPNVPDDIQKIILEETRNLIIKYPESKDLIETIWVENQDSLTTIPDSVVAATYSTLFTPDGVRGVITLNERLLSNKDYLYNGSFLLAYIHEFGHGLNACLSCDKVDAKIGDKNFNNYMDIQNNFHEISKEMYDEIDSKIGLTEDKISNEVSNYANTSSSEFFAECFAYRELLGTSNEVIDTTMKEYTNQEIKLANNK